MNGPTICRLPCGSARCTEKPSPRSRTRGTMTSSSASQVRLSPSTGSVDGIQLMAILPSASALVSRLASALLDERAFVQFGEGLLQLGLGVHHDRAIPGDRLLDRLARDQEEPDALLAGLDRHLVAAIEQHERAISRSFADQR